jgi:hypothetical protein
MKYITQIFWKIMKPELPPKHLGRWNIDYCHTKLNHKIDMSNEDHCGPCGQYAITKIDTTPIPVRIENPRDDDFLAEDPTKK